MTTYEACGSDLLIFTVNELTGGIESALSRLIGGARRPMDQHMMVVKGPGEALRLIHRHQPRLLLVCVGLAGLKQSAALIDAVHRRRPQLPLVAIAPIHDQSIERDVRAAGAAYYFALDGDSDDELLRAALRKLGLAPEVRRSGLSPPRSRGRPPARRRQRASRAPFG